MVKVSVVMLTYRHEKFLRQSVEAVLNQHTDFEFELILANDNSPDNTDEVVASIQREHPNAHRLRYFRNEDNLGVMKNSRKALEMARGEYFATCESDDYWIDPKKLQKQVDFLDENTDYSICFHNVRIEYFEDFGSKTSDYLHSGLHKGDLLNPWEDPKTFTIHDLIGEEEIWFMATASLLIRSSAFFPFPDWLEDSKSGDIPILILSARNGKIGYLPDIMAVYRKHAGGASLTDHKSDERFLRNRIYMYDHLNQDTDLVFSDRFHRVLAGYYFLLLKSDQLNDQYLKKLPIALKYLKLTFPNVPHSFELIRDHLLPPFILGIYGALKKALGLWK
ncbi:glycosyltransferase family 2 protein [Jiulongibacter sp. NS-SX5]|uniref:glycosyltransferase family 2 protein n=1 Tax=Jiulongibacter sp. NS-SX5 TaxID=3463854 RepID=UPI0040587984